MSDYKQRMNDLLTEGFLKEMMAHGHLSPTVLQHLQYTNRVSALRLSTGMSVRDAVIQTSIDTGISDRTIFKALASFKT